jgi:hypothetical protein
MFARRQWLDDPARLAQGMAAMLLAPWGTKRRQQTEPLIVVFSRDRALQLELLLETYARHVTDPPRLTVLYSVTSAAHRAAYEGVFKRYADVIEQSREEAAFRAELVEVLARSTARSVMFLVDDLMFIHPVNGRLLAAWDGADGILSLRLGGNISSSFNSGLENLPRPPTLREAQRRGERMLTWIWGSGQAEWQLALSLDGHLLPKPLVERLIRFSRFRAPNSLEAALGRFRFLFKRSPGFAFPTSRVVNLPLNSVKTESYFFPNAGIDPEGMAADHARGLKLDASTFPHEEHHSCHFPWRPPLVQRAPP